jgi:hypothetical protein
MKKISIAPGAYLYNYLHRVIQKDVGVHAYVKVDKCIFNPLRDDLSFNIFRTVANNISTELKFVK